MKIRKTWLTLLASCCLLIGAQANAQSSLPDALANRSRADAGGAFGSRQLIYVRDLGAALQPGSAPGRPLSRLRSARNDKKVEHNALALSEGIVRALNARGFRAYRLSGQSPVPPAGWLIDGTFDEQMSQGMLSSLSSIGSTFQGAPNTDVLVRITDLASDPDKPLAVIGTSGALKGQGTFVAFNPYAAAARFVIRTVEASSSLDALADKVAEQIVAATSNQTADAPVCDP